MSTERPLLVSTSLIGPILRGEKTVTRRLIRAMGNRRHIDRLLGTWGLSEDPEPYQEGMKLWRPTRKPRAGDWLWTVQSDVDDTVCEVIRPPCAVGDVLWVRETWAPHPEDTQDPPEWTVYRADRGWWGCGSRTENNTRNLGTLDDSIRVPRWRPSIHMPRWAARIFLRVESVTVERVQDITEEDARAEGIDFNPNADFYGNGFVSARAAFAGLWDSLAPDDSKWADNPFVWVIRFKLEAPNVR